MTAEVPLSEPASGRNQPPGRVRTPEFSGRTPDRWYLAALVAFTLIVRGAVLWSLRDNLNQDPDAYREIAENLLQHGIFGIGQWDPREEEDPFRPNPLSPTAYRPPLYPVLLSNLPAADGQRVSLPKVAALQLLLGIGTVWLTYLTARRVGPASAGRASPPAPSAVGNGGPVPAAASLSHPTIPLVVGLLVACDPLLLNQQTLVMTETLAAFLAILSLWCLVRFDAARTPFNAALAGGAIGLAVLCRPTFLPWLGLVGVGMVMACSWRRQFSSQKSATSWIGELSGRVTNLAALVVVAAGIISPWTIRNFQRFRNPIITTTHGGYTLYLGNNRYFYQWLKDGAHDPPWEPPRDDGRLIGLNMEHIELWEGTGRIDSILYAAAKTAIANDFPTFLHACAYRIRQLWSPLPHKLTLNESLGRRLLRYATCVWYCGVFTLAAVGIWRLRWHILQPPWVWGVLLCLVFTAVHTFYWTNMRMRAPLMPFVALVAGAAISKRKN